MGLKNIVIYNESTTFLEALDNPILHSLFMSHSCDQLFLVNACAKPPPRAVQHLAAEENGDEENVFKSLLPFGK